MSADVSWRTTKLPWSRVCCRPGLPRAGQRFPAFANLANGADTIDDGKLDT